MSPAAAAGAWAELRERRAQRRQAKQDAKSTTRRGGVYTVRDVADDYLAGHIEHQRKPKGAAEVARLVDRLLAVVSQHVVPDEAKASDGRAMGGCGVRPLEVVVEHPGLQLT